MIASMIPIRKTSSINLFFSLAKFASFAACSFLLANQPYINAQNLVSTQSGQVSGVYTNDSAIVVFKGIPYAAPPIGPLRWQPPQPPAIWTGIRKADHFSPSCMQNIRGEHLPWTREFMAQYPISENCLYLNVWTSTKLSNVHRPVLVWIHGGGFVEGAGSPAIYNGEQLVKKGIVVVSINYRLGVFGFLSHPELTRESPHHASGDYGLEDVVAALRWVHSSIAAFGGDPDRITIAGQSSGAAAVIYLTASPLAKGLFQGAIAESGAYITPPDTHSLKDAEAQGAIFATALNAHSIAQLRRIPANELIAAQQKTRFRPDIDGWFLLDTVPAIFRAGKQNDVPTITGLNADEDSYSSKYARLSPSEFKQQAKERYGNLCNEFLKLYPANSQAETILAQKISNRDRARVAMYLWAIKRSSTARSAAYTYCFDRAIPWPEHPEFGAFHSAEIPYWFRNLDMMSRPYTSIDREISDEMSGYWIHFIQTGTPNKNGLPVWPAFRSQSRTTMELGARTGMLPIADKARFNFWRLIESRGEIEK